MKILVYYVYSYIYEVGKQTQILSKGKIKGIISL